jgi:hypothetical protein
VEWVDDNETLTGKDVGGSGRGLTVNYPCFSLEILRKITKKSSIRTGSASCLRVEIVTAVPSCPAMLPFSCAQLYQIYKYSLQESAILQGALLGAGSSY